MAQNENQSNPVGADNQGWPSSMTTPPNAVNFNAYSGYNVNISSSLPSGWSITSGNGTSRAVATYQGNPNNTSWNLSAVADTVPPGSGGGTPSTTLTISSG